MSEKPKLPSVPAIHHNRKTGEYTCIKCGYVHTLKDAVIAHNSVAYPLGIPQIPRSKGSTSGEPIK